jgi:carbon storage regulator
LSEVRSPTACKHSLQGLACYSIPHTLSGGEAKGVLVLSRKVGEKILIGDKIAVTVVKIGHGGVRIGIEAPTELAVVREELATELERTERALASGETETIVE